MKKRLLMILSALILLLAGCGQRKDEQKLQVVAAIFPEYDWLRQIVGEDDSMEITLLVDDGVDPHSFQPSVSDMVTAANCDLLIYGGGESDRWLEKLEATNPNRKDIALLPLLGERAHEEEIVEGMEAEAEEGEMDEHVWLSLRNADLFCQAITEALCSLNPEKSDVYRTNLSAYQQQLSALDAQYQDAIASAAKDTIVVCDRFPFRYLVEDYGIHYYAAFPGCSAETEASFETIAFLSEKLTQLALPCVLTTESSDQSLARTILESAHSDSVILTMDSLQSVTKQQLEDGVSYLDRMENNYTILKEALTSGEKEMQ